MGAPTDGAPPHIPGNKLSPIAHIGFRKPHITSTNAHNHLQEMKQPEGGRKNREKVSSKM